MPCAQRLVHPLTCVMFTGGFVRTCQVLPFVVRSSSVHTPCPLKQFAVPSAQPSLTPTNVTSVTVKFLPPLGAGVPVGEVAAALVGTGVVDAGAVGCGFDFETAGTCLSAEWCTCVTPTSATATAATAPAATSGSVQVPQFRARRMSVAVGRAAVAMMSSTRP